MNRLEMKKFVNAFVALRNSATDEIALSAIAAYPTWKSGVAYVVGDRVLFEDTLYKVLQAHTSQDDWTPAVAVSLFAKVLIEDPNIVSEWVQPDSTNPYMNGDKVSYNGQTWISNIDNNVWAPGTYGWDVVE